MEYVELQESDEEQYSQELRYLDEPEQSSIYSEIEEDGLNYGESQLTNRSETYQTKISSRNTKNRSKVLRDQEPMDVEPLKESSTQKSKSSLSNDQELLDIEDPW